MVAGDFLPMLPGVIKLLSPGRIGEKLLVGKLPECKRVELSYPQARKKTFFKHALVPILADP
jgi:hypothetical protein